ncbi:MAG: IS66 family insertion sequence element accessory protein TnpB [Planctomycetota bacterium]
MLSVSADTKIFIAAGPTDMRKGFDGLCGLVTSVLEKDPLSGQLFLFVNRRRDKLKVLYWDGDGLAIWYRRLEQGTYQMPKVAPGQTSVQIRSDELSMLLRGIDYNNVTRRKRFSVAG